MKAIILSEAKNLRDLLLKAVKDVEFRNKLLSDPRKIAKENKVTLKPAHIEKIQKAAEFIESIKEIEFPFEEIFYPVDRLVHQWKLEAISQVRCIRKSPIFYPILYPTHRYPIGVPEIPDILYPVPWQYRQHLRNRYRTY